MSKDTAKYLNENLLVPTATKIDLDEITKTVIRRAVALQSRVRTFSKHPSYDSRADLKAEVNKLTGAFSLAMEMIGYRELPDVEIQVSLGVTQTRNARKEVEKARELVQNLYQSKTRR